MPDGAVYVGRPTRWGNPFNVDDWGVHMSIALFSDAAHGFWNPSLLGGYSDDQVHRAYDLAAEWKQRLNLGHPAEGIRVELAGCDLACWCPLDQPCHADVLLELANQ